MNQLLEYALKYAELGWKIIPIVPRQKIPLTTHGIKDATDHQDTIMAWWAHWPAANIAVSCGKPSGVYVVDVDVAEAGNVNGYKSLKEFPALPDTVRQETPRGGFHAFYKTNDPPINRNSFRPGIDIRGDGYYVVVAPSIHPNGGAYAWAQGCDPWERDLAEYPDFMRPATKAPWAADRPIRKLLAEHTLAAPVKPDVLRRASLYLAQVEPAVQGCGGHDKLLWAATALVHGFLLSDGQALDLLVREYNPRCVPEWDLSIPAEEKDFRRKVSEARKLIPQKPPGWLLEDNTYDVIDAGQMMSEEDVAKLIKNSCAKKALIVYPIQVTIDSKELDFLCKPPGLVGDICDWINMTSIREQPLLTLACTLAFCGVLFGRKVRDSLGTRTNIYCFGIAKSSAGKNHAPIQIRRLAYDAGCLDLIGGDDTSGDTAIEECLSKNPATLFMWDEIGFLLAHIRSGISPGHARVVPQLMKLYSSSGSIYKGKMYADSGNQRVIVQPCLGIYGTSTPTQFTPGVSPEQLQDGWMARCLVFRTYDMPEKDRQRCDIQPPKAVLDCISSWNTRQIKETDGHTISTFASFPGGNEMAVMQPPEQIIVPSDGPAEELFINLNKLAEQIGRNKQHLECLWSKAEENARKVALIIAAGNSFDSPEINYEIADYACRLVSHLLMSFTNETVPAITAHGIDEQKQKLLAIISRGGVEGCVTRDITRAARWSTKPQRDALLADLIEAEEVVRQRKKNRKAAYYWTTEKYLEYMKGIGNDA